MKRGQVEALARRIGLRNPEHYLLPDLKAATRARYNKLKAEGKSAEAFRKEPR